MVVALSACAPAHVDDRAEELAAREAGNPGGTNYGEFGPSDAYEDGSPHPYYGSENQWSRRMFAERAANLYYKRRGQRQLLEIIDGKPARALELAEARLLADPDDAESHFLKTIALTQLDESQEALAAAQAALAAGLPIERFVAGPRALLAPLTESDAFRTATGSDRVTIIHGPMLGAVTDNSAKIWVRTASETEFTVRLSDGGSEIAAHGTTKTDSDFTGVADIGGLSPDTQYTYWIDIGDKPVTDTFKFRTSPPRGVPGEFRVAFGGCAGYTPANERVWDTIASHDPRAVLMLGDNVYIDIPEMPGAFHDYSYYRRQSRPEFRRLVSHSAMYAIWDDHDAAFDDIWMGPYVDRPAWKPAMIRSFQTNWNNPAYGAESHPGTWFQFSIGDVDFFMLDGRAYRTNPFIADRTMLGPVQKSWLLNALDASSATFKVIASPVAWADGAKPGSIDTWSGFPEEREELLSFIENRNIEGVVLLSSDRHRSEAWKIERDSGYVFYDLLSGQLTNVHTHPVEPGALFSYNEKDSFGLLQFDTDRGDPRLTFRIVSIDNEEVAELVITRRELQRRGWKGRD